jgi:hypothetical protein
MPLSLNYCLLLVTSDSISNINYRTIVLKKLNIRSETRRAILTSKFHLPMYGIHNEVIIYKVHV